MKSTHSASSVCVALASVVVLVGLTALPEGAFAQRVPRSYVENFFGAVHLGAEDMHFADDIGATWSRHGVRWHQHQPKPGAPYTFTKGDELFEAAQEHRVKVMPVLGNVPAWASTKDDTSAVSARHYPPTEAAIDDWKAYVEAIVERHPEAEYIEIWNEPNIDWFLNAETNYQAYVDRILIPAAKVIHAHDRKVVGLSYTLEWPKDIWPPDERPSKHQRNAASAIEDLERWLSYRDAWKYIDIVSIHYSKGDVVPHSMPYGTSMMPVYEYLYQDWIRRGQIEGVWNTETGLTATEAGTAGFVALEPWERKPYAQWVPRYTLPILHWALQRDWHSRNQYKSFWYHIAQKDSAQAGMLRRTNVLTPAADSHRVSPVGQALRTVVDLTTAGDSLGTFGGSAAIGFGLDDNPEAANHFPPVRFTNYAFRVDEQILIAAWLERPGIKFGGRGQSGIEVRIDGLRNDRVYTVETIGYLHGERETVASDVRPSGGTIRLDVPRTDDPILYLSVRPSAAE